MESHPSCLGYRPVSRSVLRDRLRSYLKPPFSGRRFLSPRDVLSSGEVKERAIPAPDLAPDGPSVHTTAIVNRHRWRELWMQSLRDPLAYGIQDLRDCGLNESLHDLSALFRR
jgi:hypothetical protein